MDLKIFSLLCLHLIISTYGRAVDEPKTPPVANDTASRKAFSLDDVISNAYSSDSFNGSWINENEIFYRIDEMLLAFNLSTMKSEIVLSEPDFKDQDDLKFSLSPDRNYVLIRNQTKKIYRHSSLNRYSLVKLKDKSVRQLADGQEVSTAIWAPRGAALVYVLKNDIYYHQLLRNSIETRRLTFNGKFQAVYNGVPDWVYEEEVLGSNSALWFSPTGEHLVFATFNDTEVPEAVIMRYGKADDPKYQYPIEEKFRYPKAGKPNPRVKLHVVDLTDHGSDIIPLEAPVDVVGTDHILNTVRWFDPKTASVVWTNRVQNVSQLVTYNLQGQQQPLLTQEAPGGWILYAAEAPVHHNGYVLLLKPQPIGNETLGSFVHVTRYRYLNGVLDQEKDLTPGTIWANSIYGVNDAKRLVFFSASPPGEPSQKHLYQVSLENLKNSEPECVSCKLKTPEGMVNSNACKYISSVAFSKDFSRYVLTCSGPDPSTIRVYDAEGQELYTWSENEALRQMLTKRTLPGQRDLVVKSAGFDARVRLILPEDFDPAKKYPLLVNVYAGPDSQRITDSFSVGFEAYMTTNRRVIYAYIDGRGSTSKGTAMMYAVYRNLGSAEIEDQINVARKLQQNLPFIDRNRTGIWGWSYGGYSTATILTKDVDNVFKCGISVAPVTSWLYYDSIYTERYMALPTPDDNLENYKKSEVMQRVEKLRGKKYMLVHGTGDDNVHFQQSMILTRSLAEADILFDQVSYPDEAHHLGHVTKHLYHTMDKFWSECFGYNSTA